MVSAVKDVDKDSYVKIAISSIAIREDQDFKDKNSGVNNNLKNYFNSAGMRYEFNWQFKYWSIVFK